MRQRNTSGQTVDIPSLNLSVEPGEVVDHEHPISGFTPVKGKAEKDAEATEAKAETKSEPTAEQQEDPK